MCLLAPGPPLAPPATRSRAPNGAQRNQDRAGFKNSFVYLDLVGSLGAHSTWLLGAVMGLWLRPAMHMRLANQCCRSAVPAWAVVGPFTDRRVLARIAKLAQSFVK
jgi:hypothetical protein